MKLAIWIIIQYTVESSLSHYHNRQTTSNFDETQQILRKCLCIKQSQLKKSVSMLECIPAALLDHEWINVTTSDFSTWQTKQS